MDLGGFIIFIGISRLIFLSNVSLCPTKSKYDVSLLEQREKGEGHE